MMTIVALVAGSLFAYAAVPTMFRTMRAGKHLGTPLDIIVAIFMGTILMYSYLFFRVGFDLVLAINYGVEALSWGVLLYYRLFRNVP